MPQGGPAAAGEASATGSRPRTLIGLQYLRGLAASAVVVFHASARTDHRFLLGEAGVDLFFVLSGFLMIVITSAETRPLAFLGDRIRRIVPVYWAATAAMALIALAGLSPGIRLTIGHVLTSLFFVPAASPSNGLVWPLLVQGWTLNMEMFFYLVFAAILAVVPRAWQLAALTAALGGLVVVGALVAPRDPILLTYTSPMLLEFVAGGWLGLAWKRHGAPSRRLGWPLVALAAAGFVLAFRHDDDALRIVTFGIPALLLLAGVLALEHRPGGIGRVALPTMIGDASYSIYLWHTFAISALHLVSARLRLGAGAEIALGTAGGIALGLVGYRLLEQPLLKVMKRRRARLGVPIPAGV